MNNYNAGDIYTAPCGKNVVLSHCDVCNCRSYRDQQSCAYHCGMATQCFVAGICGECGHDDCEQYGE
jgi:hypothetical protein